MIREFRVIRLLILISVYTLLFKQSAGQTLLVKNHYSNFAYLGMETLLEAAAEGFSCKSIILRSVSAKIKKEGCHFWYYPTRVGKDTVDVFATKSGITKKIGTTYLNVRKLPEPEVSIGPYRNGYVKKGALRAQYGVGASQVTTSYGHEEFIRVDSFTLIIFRGKTISFSINNTGSTFNDSIKAAFDTLQTGDVVMVANIRATSFNSSAVMLKPLELIVIE